MTEAIYGAKTKDGGFMLQSTTISGSEVIGFSCVPHQSEQPDCFVVSR